MTEESKLITDKVLVPTVDVEDTIVARDTGWYCVSPDKDRDQELVSEYHPGGGFLQFLVDQGIDNFGRILPAADRHQRVTFGGGANDNNGDTINPFTLRDGTEYGTFNLSDAATVVDLSYNAKTQLQGVDIDTVDILNFTWTSGGALTQGSEIKYTLRWALDGVEAEVSDTVVVDASNDAPISFDPGSATSVQLLWIDVEIVTIA